jgi:uncharacterized protein (DUF305 family)
MNRRRAKLAASAGVLGLALFLSACGDSDSDAGANSGGTPGASPSASSSMDMPDDVNEQDAAFASNMIVHHREAIEMADMARSQAENPKVLALADKIKAAQAPEIETLSTWLTDWGMQPPAEGAAMDHGGSAMPGMMTPEEMEELGGMKGAEFDEMFLTMMIKHHEGAVTMAQEEVAEGKNESVKEFAQKVIDDQTAEIDEMKALLG